MTHRNALLFRLEVEIARTGADRFGEELVHQSNDRRPNVGICVGRIRIRDEPQVLNFDRRRNGIWTGRGAGIDTIELQRDLFARRDLPPHAVSGGKADSSLYIEIERVRCGDDDGGAINTKRNDEMPSRPTLGKERDGAWIDARKVSAWEVESG